MRIVIVGAGFTGVQLAKLLINEKNQVTIIDNDETNVRHCSNQLDCNVICADGNNLEVLEDANIAKADALVCVTSSDEVNMITCSLVDAVYPKVLKIARVRNYAYYVNTASAEKKHSDDASHRPLYGINYMIHPDVEAAKAIVETVANGAIGNVISFDDSDIEIARIRIEETSSFDGVALKDLRSLSDVHFLVTYVEQDGETSLPSGNTVFHSGCTVGVLLSKKDLPAVMELCGSHQKELKKIALIGAGRIGTIVAEKIIKPQKNTVLSKLFTNLPNKRNSDFVIIDSDEQIAKEASVKFPDARVFCADATDENFLNEEGITDFDLAICATHNHEMNMVLAAFLESLGVKQTVSLVTSSAFAGIALKLGVDVPIPLRDSVVDSIMSHLRGKAVQEVHTINEGELELVECVVSEKARFNGKTLSEISSPGEFLVLLNQKAHKENLELVNGATRIETGDRVVLITKSEISKKILENFA